MEQGLETDKPWVVSAEGLMLTVRVTPKGGRDAIDGIARLSDGRCVLKARVAAPPADGEANDALARLLAREFHVAPRDVTLVGGATSRVKRLLIRGDPAPVLAALGRQGESDSR